MPPTLAQASLELEVILLPHRYWNYKYEPPILGLNSDYSKHYASRKLSVLVDIPLDFIVMISSEYKFD